MKIRSFLKSVGERTYVKAPSTVHESISSSHRECRNYAGDSKHTETPGVSLISQGGWGKTDYKQNKSVNIERNAREK